MIYLWLPCDSNDSDSETPVVVLLRLSEKELQLLQKFRKAFAVAYSTCKPHLWHLVLSIACPDYFDKDVLVSNNKELIPDLYGDSVAVLTTQTYQYLSALYAGDSDYRVWLDYQELVITHEGFLWRFALRDSRGVYETDIVLWSFLEEANDG